MDETDVILIVAVAALAIYLLNKAGAAVQSIENEVSGLVTSAENLL